MKSQATKLAICLLNVVALNFAATSVAHASNNPPSARPALKWVDPQTSILWALYENSPRAIRKCTSLGRMANTDDVVFQYPVPTVPDAESMPYPSTTGATSTVTKSGLGKAIRASGLTNSDHYITVRFDVASAPSGTDPVAYFLLNNTYFRAFSGLYADYFFCLIN